MREVRTRHERVSQGDLAGAVGDAHARAADVDSALRRITGLRATIATASEERHRLLAQGAAATTIAHLERYLRRLRRDLDVGLDEHQRAEALHRGQLAEVDAARGRLNVARAEREIIERHFAVWRAERRKLAERRED